MTAVRADRLDAPAGARNERVVSWMRSLTDDALAGRIVWCAASSPPGLAAAGRLQALLHGELAARLLAVAAIDAPASLAQRLDAMLAGLAGPLPLGSAAHEEYRQGAESTEQLIGERVAPGDAVVLHDALTVSLAGPVRERGAHAVWHLPMARGPQTAGARAALAFLEPHAAAVDAFVLAWEEPRSAAARVAALVPSADLIEVKDVTTAGDREASERRTALAWSSVLGDIVGVDRVDHVGGTLHVRPAVAAR
jgi:hypothetical protein